MAKIILSLFVLFFTHPASASLIQYFKDEQGETKWQYVANFSSGLLILLLSIVAISLFFSHRRAQKANRELKEIRDALEQRVLERTATLDKSNQLLKESTDLLRFSEAYIKDILESMPLMLIGLDKEMNVTQWNQYAEKNTGVNHQGAIGKNLWEAYPPITIAPSQVSEVLESNTPMTVKHSQRGQYYFDITIYPLQEQLETGVVILIDNVTKRILAENKLVQRDKMSSMGELASAMAHDIDIPLRAILNDLQAVHQAIGQLNPDDQNTTNIEATQELLTDAAEKGKQASGVIANLLDFSRSHGGEKRDAQIPDIVEHSIELANSVLQESDGLRFQDIKIERHYENDLPSIPCYVAELQQVFLSLFRHACHSMSQVNKEGFEPTLHLDISECYGALWIKVQHNGLGLSHEEQQFIFEPFFNTADGKESEVGKRLSFSYFIITEYQQGQIAVTSDPDIGTTFHIQLQLN